MPIEKIYQNSTSTGTHTSSLGFIRKLNNNSNELGTTTKLNLKDRNTPELIKKAFREQAKNKINYATPGGPEYTMNRVVDGVVQLYNSNIETSTNIEINTQDSISVILNENPTKFTEAILKSVKEETYEMFPMMVDEGRVTCAFGFNYSPFPALIYSENDNDMMYVYIDENTREALSLLSKTITNYTEPGWYVLDSETQDPSSSEFNLTEKVSNFDSIKNITLTVDTIYYSNLNDESREVVKTNTSDLYDLISSIKVDRDTKILSGGTYKILINESPSKFTKALLDSAKVQFKDYTPFYCFYEQNDAKVIFIGIQISSGLNFPTVYFVDLTSEEPVPEFYGYIDSNVIEMSTYIKGSSITGYTEPGWYKYTTEDNLAYKVEKANFDSIKNITLTISTQSQFMYYDSIKEVSSVSRPITYKAYFYDLIKNIEEISVPNTPEKIKVEDNIVCELNNYPIEFFNSLYDNETLPMLIGNKISIGNVDFCGVKLDAASSYNKDSEAKYLIYVTSKNIQMLRDNGIDTSTYTIEGAAEDWYELVGNALKGLSKKFNSINNFYIKISNILSYKIKELDKSVSLTEVNVSDFKDLFKTIYIN